MSDRAISRRNLLAAGIPAVALSATCSVARQDAGESDDEPGEISGATIAEAEKLAALEFTDSERAQIAQTIPKFLPGYEALRERELDNGVASALVFDPVRAAGLDPLTHASSIDGEFRRSGDESTALPDRDIDIAFAPVTSLSRWIERRALTSTRLTEIYLKRLRRIGPKLECVVTLTEELARRQAARADEEIAAGNYRGPLHGIPYGAKDLFDTVGLPTTWGAAPYRNRVAERDADVIRRLESAGAVLIAKTTLGALAYGDIWFGGRTNNPFNLEQGSSGSSAGSAAGTVAGLFGFSLGTETYGSIVSPCMRCGATGLRPTFGRVSRAGAMALCWSLDKVGPICRTVEDTMLVLAEIHGHSTNDASSTSAPLGLHTTESIKGLRVGYAPEWFEHRLTLDLDRQALDHLRTLGAELVEVDLPDWPYDALTRIVELESAAAHQTLTLNNRDDELVWQDRNAWPNTFRSVHFVPAVELIQMQRFRAQVCAMMAERFAQVDAMLSPSFGAKLLLVTNMTGHPSLTVRTGFRARNRPHGITLWGRLFDEGTLARLGMALESSFDVWHRRPPVD